MNHITKEEIETEDRECFYCNALVAERTGKGDHFPVPISFGGTLTVPCCISCHDMKDRFRLDKWPMEWWSKVFQDFSIVSRETKIFIAKVMYLGQEYLLRRTEGADFEMLDRMSRAANPDYIDKSKLTRKALKEKRKRRPRKDRGILRKKRREPIASKSLSIAAFHKGGWSDDKIAEYFETTADKIARILKAQNED